MQENTRESHINNKHVTTAKKVSRHSTISGKDGLIKYNRHLKLPVIKPPNPPKMSNKHKMYRTNLFKKKTPRNPLLIKSIKKASSLSVIAAVTFTPSLDDT